MALILFIRMKMRVWRRMEVEPVFAHKGEMTLGGKTPQLSYKYRNHHHGQKFKTILRVEEKERFQPDENREVTALRLHRLMELNLVSINSILLLVLILSLLLLRTMSSSSLFSSSNILI